MRQKLSRNAGLESIVIFLSNNVLVIHVMSLYSILSILVCNELLENDFVHKLGLFNNKELDLNSIKSVFI